MKSLHLSLDIGRVKNPSKKPIAEKAILELEEELLKQEPTGGLVSQLQNCRLQKPIAEIAILELEEELLKQEPAGGPVSLLQNLILAFAIQVCRLGNKGLNEVSPLMNNFPFQTGKTFSVNIGYVN